MKILRFNIPGPVRSERGFALLIGGRFYIHFVWLGPGPKALQAQPQFTKEAHA